MNAAETNASNAIADCTPLTVVSRSCTTAAIDTFINDVSTTSTNIAMASSSPRRRSPAGRDTPGGYGPFMLGPGGRTGRATGCRSRVNSEVHDVVACGCPDQP